MDQHLPFTKNFNKLQLIIEKRPNLEKFKESYLKFSGSAVKDVIKLDKLEFTWSL